VPEAYFSRSPELAFRDFKDHVNDLLSKLLTDVPLTHVAFPDNTATMEFRNTDGEPCVKVGRGYYLYLGQTLQAKREGKNQYRLRTVAYAYRIAEGPRREDPYVTRWEYNSRELPQGKGLPARVNEFETSVHGI
jgi:hypothetical protein